MKIPSVVCGFFRKMGEQTIAFSTTIPLLPKADKHLSNERIIATV
jgi:hypothetical protein